MEDAIAKVVPVPVARVVQDRGTVDTAGPVATAVVQHGLLDRSVLGDKGKVAPVERGHVGVREEWEGVDLAL